MNKPHLLKLSVYIKHYLINYYLFVNCDFFFCFINTRNIYFNKVATTVSRLMAKVGIYQHAMYMEVEFERSL